jgi:hypothetical protein
MIVRGPLVLLTPKVCHMIEAPLHKAAERARAEGVRLDPEFLAFLRDVRTLAAEYRRGDLTGPVTGPTCTTSPASDDDPDIDDQERMLTSMEAAEIAGISAHGVAEAARRGRLTGQRIAGQWRFHQADVDVWTGASQR